MKVKLNQIILAVYLILVSIFIKDYNLVSWGLFAAALTASFFLSGNKIFSSLENLIYLIIALSPFPYLLALFALYLPYSVFGMAFSKKSFVKSYIFGFAVSIISTILLYTASNYFSLKINFLTILAFFYIPAVIALFIWIKKSRSLGFLKIDSKEYLAILAILAATIFVAISIVNNESLFISNGTYMFTKFNLIFDASRGSGEFPIYDPATSSGESPLLFEAPLVFSSMAFANIILNFIPKVMFYNLYTLFILFLSTLGLALLLEKLIGFEEDSKKPAYILIIILGSVSIGLNFYFAQYLEAFKEFFIFPINYLMLSLILEKPKEFREMAIILCLIAISFITHTSQGVGIVFLSFSLIALILIFQKIKINEIKEWILKNKLKIVFSLLLIFLLPLFYIAPAFIFKNFLEDKGPIEFNKIIERAINYGRDFFVDVPVSLNHPELTRNDDKKFGPLISILGIVSFLALLVLRKMPKSLALFASAYLAHFIISALAINHPMIGNLEYGYRTAFPYLLILLVASICAFIAGITIKYLKYALLALLVGNLLYILPMVKTNIGNIHMESFISGGTFKEEIDFAKTLPVDGRMITYGLFSNTIDPGMAALTGHYLSRYHLTEYARTRSIYSKIHGTHSFGQEKFVMEKTPVELYNYLRLGGYRYIFANICHPAGAFVVQSLYPSFVQPLYQNQCSVYVMINGTNYAEKISVLEKVDETVYKNDDGYKYFTLSPHFNFGKDMPYSKGIINPEQLEFKRIKPTEVIINGNFKDNEWIVFKEDYFGRWKAYMNNKEVPIFATNHNSILIKTIEGSSITLKYSVLQIERVIGLLSFISALIILITLLAWLKPDTALNQ